MSRPGGVQSAVDHGAGEGVELGAETCGEVGVSGRDGLHVPGRDGARLLDPFFVKPENTGKRPQGELGGVVRDGIYVTAA